MLREIPFRESQELVNACESLGFGLGIAWLAQGPLPGAGLQAFWLAQLLGAPAGERESLGSQWSPTEFGWEFGWAALGARLALGWLKAWLAWLAYDCSASF